MSHKFISFLGAGNYEKCNYTLQNQTIENIKFVQDALLQIKCHNFTKTDSICFLLTEKARQTHWQHNESGEKNLEEIIQDLYPDQESRPIIQAISIPDGKNETEIWEIFQKMIALLEKDDTVIFDITHGFRSLPMLAFAALNYTAFLKHITIEGIYYGVFETRTNDTAPIFNLTEFYTLMQWASAADSFVSYGYTDKLSTLINESAREHRGSKAAGSRLKEVSDDLNTVRGKKIMEGSSFQKCLKQIEKIENDTLRSSAHPAFQPFFEQIKDVFSPFKENNPYNFLKAARLHLQHGREQQCITLLLEGLLTALLHQSSLDYSKREIREAAAKWIHEKTREKNGKPNEGWLPSTTEKDTIEAIEKAPLFKGIIETKLYDNLTQLRNDINHGGYNESSAAAAKIITNAQKYYDDTEALFSHQAG
ncbi:TIGR02221 family CRISPR-associated protein [Treponema vincentii]|uniref:TIGR02221 family CRISPR-associated protein n=1 Tax=Treponema vincentii TaxID=69710 RepID=UPI0035F5A402